MIGTTLSHYRITAKIGEGGMGEVYRAHDERLDRDVAIKVLPEAVAKDADRLARFEREAKAIAKLAHPNILEIHELGEHEGRPFIVTEILDGETLKDRLDHGSLGWRKAAEIGAAIADGIAAAHLAGIVHRDLKPSNVFLTTDGRVKVLDFGLARSLEIAEADQSLSPTVSHLTDPGSVFGTVGYMSPEQVRGQPADHRADIFALGCVLYEMACGRRAFSRDTAADTMAAILKEEPSDLRSLSGDLPPALTSVIDRCLAKKAEARFQTAQDLAFALRSALRDDSGPIVQPTSDELSIVVLPFDNLSPDPDQEYFADGLTEEIISDLSKIRTARVISRTSAALAKESKKDLPTIGRELNVRYVLEGGVRKAGNNLRITAQLIEAQNDAHLWSEKYSGTLDDVFDIQEKVSRSIVDALKVELTSEESSRIAERPIEDARAYECYTRAAQYFWLATEESLARALHLLESGLEIVGNNDLLYSMIGMVHFQYINFGVDLDPSHLDDMDASANKLSALNPSSPYLDQLTGIIQFKRGNMKLAVTHLKRFLRYSPNEPIALLTLAYIYVISGKTEAAAPLINRLLEIDPLTAWNHWPLAWMELVDGRPQEMLRAFQKIHEMDPDFWLHKLVYALGLSYHGRMGEAFPLLSQIREEVPDTVGAHLSLFMERALRGEKEGAAQAVTPMLEAWAKGDEVLPVWMAEFYSLSGATDLALDWLEKAVDNGCICYPLFSETDPFLENIRGEQRFKDLMVRVKHEWETFEV